VNNVPKVKLIYTRTLNDVVERNGGIPWTIDNDEDYLLHHLQDAIVLIDEGMYKYAQRPKVTCSVIKATQGLYYETFCAARHIANGDKDIVILGAGFLIPEVEKFIDEVYETVIMNNLVHGTKFYNHQRARELISEERTTAELDGRTYRAIRRSWKLKKIPDSPIMVYMF
jgi:dihydrofolate reductase